MSFSVITPYNWPQDKLEVPNGFGGMPPVDYGNENVVSGEYFGLTGEFIYTENTPAFTQQTQILNTPQDGDFWCDSIGVVSWLENPTGEGVVKDLQHFLTSVVAISDIRTGRTVVYNPGIVPTNHPAGMVFPPNSIPLNFFRKLPQSGTESSAFGYTGDTPTPNGFRTTQSLIQPLCFTRQGGIQVTITSLDDVPANQTFQMSICFNGWKEYANASR